MYKSFSSNSATTNSRKKKKLKLHHGNQQAPNFFVECLMKQMREKEGIFAVSEHNSAMESGSPPVRKCLVNWTQGTCAAAAAKHPTNPRAEHFQRNVSVSAWL